MLVVDGLTKRYASFSLHDVSFNVPAGGWDDDVFTGLLTRFRIDDRKKINELSTGMRVKLGIAMALSHGARLIVLDEPTSGLDPVARDELLELFQEVVADGERGVLFSTHITDDLDRSADHLAFIRNGRIVAHDTKDDLISDHVLVRGGADDLTDDLRQQMIGHKRNAFGFTGLAHTAELTPSDTLHTERPDLASLMRYYELQEAS
ncbi:AAA family ATPase [Microlunatus sp. Y2014]|uniref:AAA family ATPase n=1 Tax=Microlunatus sp. Y2014 TaxID=3418488 RepID=UPI003DA73C7B